LDKPKYFANEFKNISGTFGILPKQRTTSRPHHNKSKQREARIQATTMDQKPASKTVQLNLHQAILAQARQKAEQQNRANNNSQIKKRQGKKNGGGDRGHVVNVGQLISSISVRNFNQIKSVNAAIIIFPRFPILK
jgi:hypothetical protein